MAIIATGIDLAQQHRTPNLDAVHGKDVLRQRVIFQIEHQLSRTATVRESALLSDRITGQSREVDVVVEAKVGHHDIRICIECHDKGRKSTVEWIEQMFQKHKDLPSSKLVLVSARGFSGGAEKKARALGLETIVLEDAETHDWVKTFGPRQQFEVLALRICAVLLVPCLAPGDAHPAPRWLRTFNLDGTHRAPLGELVDSATSSSGPFTEGVIQAAKSEILPTSILCELRPTPPFAVMSPANELEQIERIVIIVEVHPTTLSDRVRTTSYRGTSVAYSSGETPIGDFVLTFVKPPGGSVTGALSIQDSSSGQVQTVDMRQVNEASVFAMSNLVRSKSK